MNKEGYIMCYIIRICIVVVTIWMVYQNGKESEITRCFFCIHESVIYLYDGSNIL